MAENENDTSRRRKADVLPAAGSSSGSGLRAQAQFCARLFGNATVALLFVMSFLSTFNVVLSRYAIQPVLIKRYGLSLRAKGFALAYLGVISAGANAFLVRPLGGVVEDGRRVQQNWEGKRGGVDLGHRVVYGKPLLWFSRPSQINLNLPRQVRPIVARLSTGQALISASLLVGVARAILSLVPNVYMWCVAVAGESGG